MICHGDVWSIFFQSYDLLSSPALYKPGPSLAQSVKISPKNMIKHVTFFFFYTTLKCVMMMDVLVVKYTSFWVLKEETILEKKTSQQN